MSGFHDDYRDDARRGTDDPDARAERDVELDNLEAIEQTRRDRVSDHADYDWTRTAAPTKEKTR